MDRNFQIDLLMIIYTKKLCLSYGDKSHYKNIWLTISDLKYFVHLLSKYNIFDFFFQK